MSLTYDEGVIQPEQRVGTLVLWPLVFAAVVSTLVTVLIVMHSPMHSPLRG